MQLIQKIQIGLVLVVFIILSLALPTPTKAACGGDCSVVDCGCAERFRGRCVERRYCTQCGGNGCEVVGCGPGQYPCNRPGGCCNVGPVTPPKPDPVEPPPPPPCSPSCGSPLCGQSDGCGGSCSNSDTNSWGAWSACSATCGGGTQSRTNACGTSQSQGCNTVSCPGPWWQVKDGSVHSGSDIFSNIPGACAGGCTPSLLTGVSGLASYLGTLGVGGGTLSQDGTNWQAETVYAGTYRLKPPSFAKHPVDSGVLQVSLAPRLVLSWQVELLS